MTKEPVVTGMRFELRANEKNPISKVVKVSHTIAQGLPVSVTASEVAEVVNNFM